MPEKISAVIITKNEEHNIVRCLASLKWADEIVVIDSGSVDRTVEICKEFGCRVYETEWLGFGKTKKLGVEKASNDWIFSIDADEEVTKELKERICSLDLSDEVPGYKIKRNSFYLGRMIKFSGWGNEYILRLFNRKHGNFNEAIVHEQIEIKGETEKIREFMLHYTYPDISSHLKKIDHYTGLGATQKYEKGKKSGVIHAWFRGLFKFFKMYILNLGFLDGKEGFVLSTLSGLGVSLKYFKLWALNKQNNSN